MMELINDQFQGVDFTVDFINVNCPGTFLGDVTGYVQLSNPFDRTAIQAGIDELLNQLTWDDVKADVATLAAQNPGSTPCGICVNWKNHYQHGNGLSYDAAPPWAGGPANFFAAPMPDIDNRQQYNLFDANGHMLTPYNTTIGAKILEFGFISSVFGGDEKGDLLISFPAVVANQGTHGIIGTVFEFVASKILVVAGGPYCDDGITQDYIGGIPQPPPPETRTNITFAPDTEIPRIPFVWLDNYAWRVVIHEYFPGTC